MVLKRSLPYRFPRKDTLVIDQPLGRSGVDTLAQQPMDPVRTFETPLVGFPADIQIPSNFTGSVPLPLNCAQIAFIDVIPGTWASFNGGGARKIKDGFVYNGLFQTLEIVTDATGVCTVQVANF